MPVDAAMLAGDGNSGYTTDSRGNCHGPDGRFTQKSNCGADIKFVYGAAADLSVNVASRAFPVHLGGGYRLGDLKSGAYATVSTAVTRETARWFAVVGRAGPDLMSIGFTIGVDP